MSLRLRFAVWLFALAAMLAVWIGTGGGELWGDKSRTVQVGLYENAPKIYTAASGQPAGLFVELLAAIAHAENWRLDYIDCEWADCLARLERGALDLMPDVAFSSERAARFDFHQVSVASSWSQVYSAPDLAIQTLADLAERRIALLDGGIQQSFFAQLMAGSGLTYQPILVDSLDAGYAAVAEGDADAVVTNSFFAARNGGQYRLRETPILFLPSNLYYAADKGRNADLLRAIDAHLQQWRSNSASIYFDALRRAMAMPPEVLLPGWLRWLVLALGAGLLVLLAISLLLRWQVARRTAALEATGRALATERNDLERRVAERTDELQAVFDSASVGILLLKDRQMVRCNRRMAEMFGYAPGELEGQSTRIWYPDQASWERVGREGYRPVWRGETDVREQEVVRKDGSRFWVRMSARAVAPADPGKGAVAVIEDISAEQAAMAEMERAKVLAEEATQMKSAFLATMSHEIRTPMNAILGMLYLALNNELAPGVRYHLEKAQAAAHSLLGIINDILDMSRIEAGKISLEQVEFGLDTVLERITDAIGYEAEQKGVEFLIRYDVTIPPLLIGDPLRLGQILLNLCGNAIKFTDEGEVELALRCLHADDTAITIQVCVRDTGIGMPPEVQANLFQHFGQGDRSTTRRYGGSGLGLAISNNLVAMMGGRLWIEESEPARGTTICFTAQLQAARQTASRRQTLLRQAQPLLRGVRVLVVDDNAVSREIMSDILRLIRVDVATAASGQAALTALTTAEPPFDLVLMDWRMPGMNGDEVTQRIHCDLALTRQPKVIMVTAYGREDVIRLARAANVDGFLIKPVSPSTLLDTLLSVLGYEYLLSAAESPATTLPASHRPQLAGIRLLLVEDNAVNREFAAELLRSEGVQVVEVEDGEQAVTRVQQETFDAVLMDIQMPQMDGLEATRRIRALAQTPGGEHLAELPIIAMTALAMVHDEANARAAGMNAHIAKPVEPAHLLNLLAQWVPAAPPPAATPPATETAAAVPALPPDLAVLTALDARAGVHRIGGKVEAYRRQLRRFREHYADAVQALARLVSEGDADRAEAYCHALKGVAGNIGAVALSETVTALDAELKQGQLPSAERLTPVRESLQAVLYEIDSLLPAAAAGPHSEPASEPLDPAALQTRLQQLAQLLETDLGAVESLLSGLRAGVTGTPWAAAVASIAAKVEVFDIDQAQAELAALLAKLAAGGEG